MKTNSIPSPDWHTKTTEYVQKQLKVNTGSGLSHINANDRLLSIGRNEIAEAKQRSFLKMFVAQFTDFIILILIAAAIISGLIGEPQDTIAIFIIVTLNALIGSIQEYRAEKAVAALRLMATPEAQVLRDGNIEKIPAYNIVPGDVVLLEAGNVIPADLHLFETAKLTLDESALTGESQTVIKNTQASEQTDLPLGDRLNMAYKGTLVTSGRGSAIAVATGMNTELGRVASLLLEAESDKTPLQKRLARFGKHLAMVILAVCAIIFITGLLRGEDTVLMLLTAISLAVAAIPEALPAVVTISLALGAKKMIKQNALIRHLPAVETLGSITYICSDKTGTLTENKMYVDTFHIDRKRQAQLSPSLTNHNHPHTLLASAMALSNDTKINAQGELTGDPTEVALYNSALESGFNKTRLEQETPRRGEIPFDTERRCMATLHQTQTDIIAYIKGAPEAVLPYCKTILRNDGEAILDKETILHEAATMAQEGYRVLAFAYRRFAKQPTDLSPDNIERDLTLLALVGLIDPPREGAADAVATCKTAGITPVMITGDHPGTARAIAQRLGIIGTHETVLTGQEIARLTQEEFRLNVRTTRVFARVNPEQKIDIVNSLQENGEYVAMTGDGVNDAPALKQADIGIAMGKKGTDVAREAADMVLLDDNFITIVSAIREGRRIFDNIRKFIKYTMTSNAGEIWTLFLAPFLGLPIPLLPIHILWINLVTDGLPGLALAAEPYERGIMKRAPRPPNESIFAHGTWQHMVWVGLLIGGLSIFSQAWAYKNELENWQTMVFTVLTFCQLAHALTIRSERDSIFTIGLRSNLHLLGAIIITVSLQLCVIYLPLFNVFFKTNPLSMEELAICLTLPIIVFISVEIEKYLIRQGLLYQAT